MPFELGIVIPTYNEKMNIVGLLDQIWEHIQTNQITATVLVMDDNSPDGTAQLVLDWIKDCSSKNAQVACEFNLQVRSGKQGLASAYKQGFNKLREKAQYVMSMDADHSHKPQYLIELVKQARNGYHVVIGSRYVPGGGIENWDERRKWISKQASVYARAVLGMPIRDFTGGFNLYNSAVFEQLDLDSIAAEGYLFQIEMKYKLVKLGYKYIEIPIIFPDRVAGKSKFDKRIVWEAFWGVLRLRLNPVLPKNKLALK